MLRKIILSAAAATALGVASMPADAHGYFSVGIGLPGPVVVAPPFYPGPVYVRPAPAYYGPHYYGPRYYAPPIAYGPHWHYGWHHPYYGWR